MAALGILIELIADLQKSAAKKKNPKMFVSTGLYRIVRCPNYFGELLLWTGVFVSGISVCNSVFQWSLVILGFVGIIYVMFSGARRLEIRQDKNYGDNPAYQEYISKTPIILPLIPIFSVKKYKCLWHNSGLIHFTYTRYQFCASCRKTKVTFLINTFTGSTLPKPDK